MGATIPRGCPRKGSSHFHSARPCAQHYEAREYSCGAHWFMFSPCYPALKGGAMHLMRIRAGSQIVPGAEAPERYRLQASYPTQRQLTFSACASVCPKGRSPRHLVRGTPFPYAPVTWASRSALQPRLGSHGPSALMPSCHRTQNINKFTHAHRT